MAPGREPLTARTIPTPKGNPDPMSSNATRPHRVTWSIAAESLVPAGQLPAFLARLEAVAANLDGALDLRWVRPARKVGDAEASPPEDPELSFGSPPAGGQDPGTGED